MDWSPSLIATAISIAVASVSVLLDRCLKYFWKDGRTRKHKVARRWLLGLSILSIVAALALTIGDKSRAEKSSQRLAQALKEAEDERKSHALSGQLVSQKGEGRRYTIGDSGTSFFLAGSNSLLDAVIIPPLQEIAAQNRIVVETGDDGSLKVSAKIRSRDGLLAEILNNEWKVAPPPRTWDRNYSTNALEIKNTEGKVVFQIRLEAGIAHFQGIFSDSDGNAIAFTGEPGAGAVTTIAPKNTAISLPTIKPLFKYPSELHLGVFSDP